MEIWMGVGLTASAAALFWMMTFRSGLRRAADGGACVALIVFGTIAGSAVARTLENDTVFMTEVHSVLLKGSFLVAGAYLGIYGVARLAFETWRGRA